MHDEVGLLLLFRSCGSSTGQVGLVGAVVWQGRLSKVWDEVEGALRALVCRVSMSYCQTRLLPFDSSHSLRVQRDAQ